MSYDSLSGKTDEYIKNKTEHNDDVAAFLEEKDKFDALLSGIGNLDDDIQDGIQGISRELDAEKERLNNEKTELDSCKKELSDTINQKLSKLIEANGKLESLASKKYAGGASKATDKCRDYIGQLEDMLEKLEDEPSSTNVTAGISSILDKDICGNSVSDVYTNDKRLNARMLTKTQYGFNFQTVCGVYGSFYDDPNGTANLIIKKQGNNNYQMKGTCGLCQCANQLTMAGISGYDENRIIEAALATSENVRNSMDISNPNPGNRGGTTVADRQEILKSCGLDTYILPISFVKSKTMEQINEAIRTGHGVIVSVDVARLWRNGQRGGHAISIISVSEDGKSYIYSDTGMGGIHSVCADDLMKSFTGRPANVTTNIIR